MTLFEVKGRADRFTVCPYWPSARWWAVYMDGELLDVYATKALAQGYADYMNYPPACVGSDGNWPLRRFRLAEAA